MKRLRAAFERWGGKVHQWAYIRSDGRVGKSLFGVPALLLRTTGRRTGRTRTVALVFLPDGDNRVVVASNAGADRPPGWLFNLEANPDAEVQVGRQRHPVRAHVAEGEERARLWPLVNRNNHGRYDEYQAQTSRTLQVVVLAPRR